jgi:hypothetical protein
MDNHIEDSGKIMKCMDMENFHIHKEKLDTKVSLKMVCSMDLEHNMPMIKDHNVKNKLIKHLLG